MRNFTLILVLIMGGAAANVRVGEKDADLRLRNLDLSGLTVNADQWTLTATLEVKGARIFGEAAFDFYRLQRPPVENILRRFTISTHCQEAGIRPEERT